MIELGVKLASSSQLIVFWLYMIGCALPCGRLAGFFEHPTNLTHAVHETDRKWNTSRQAGSPMKLIE